MWGIFKRQKNELIKFNNHISYAFSKVSKDINNVQQWITHIHDKNSSLERSHFSHVEVTKRDVENLTKWVHYLHKHNLELQSYIKDITGHLIKLQDKDNSFVERLVALEANVQGHLRTQKGMSQGQVKDKSLGEKLPQKIEKNVFVNKPSLNGSQLELLNIFYESDRPLSYNELAKILGKKNKSVRNLIYEIRDKGLDIKSKFVGLRKKGFYLSKEEKIQLTGR